jgi:hypothetical protein
MWPARTERADADREEAEHSADQRERAPLGRVLFEVPRGRELPLAALTATQHRRVRVPLLIAPQIPADECTRKQQAPEHEQDLGPTRDRHQNLRDPGRSPHAIFRMSG